MISGLERNQGKEVGLEKKVIVLFTNGNAMDVDSPSTTVNLARSRCCLSEYSEDYRAIVKEVIEGDYTFYLAKWEAFSNEITLDEFCLLYYGKSSEQLEEKLKPKG